MSNWNKIKNGNYSINSNSSWNKIKSGNYSFVDNTPKVHTASATRKKEESNSWFNKGAFDDGYQFGDVSKSLVSTIGDFGRNIGKDFSRGLEGAGDTAMYGLSWVLDKFGAKSAADTIKRYADYDQTGHDFGEYKNDNPYTKKLNDFIGSNSFSGNKLDETIGSIGNIIANAGISGALGNSPASSFASSFITSYGNAKSEAIRNGASNDDASKYGMINGLSEGISEQIFDAIPFLPVDGQIGNKFKNTIGKALNLNATKLSGKIANKVIDSLGEGSEEVVSNVLQSIGSDVMHSIDKNYNYARENQTGNAFMNAWNAATSEDSLNSFVSAALSSALFNAGASVVSNTQKGKIVKEYANENHITVTEAKKVLGDTKNGAYNALERLKNDETTQGMVAKRYAKDNNITELAAIQKIDNMSKDEQQSLKDKYTKPLKFTEQLDLDEQAENNAYAQINTRFGKSIKSQIEAEIDNNIVEMEKQNKTTYSEDQKKTLRKNFRDHYQDMLVNPGKYSSYTFEESDNELENKERESFSKAGLNNTEDTRDFIDKTIKFANKHNAEVYALSASDMKKREEFINAFDKYAKDNNIKVTNDNKESLENEFLKNNFNAFVSSQEDGKNVIYVNSQSNAIKEQTMWHEFTHLMEKSSHYKEYQDLIKSLSSKDNVLENETKDVQSIYGQGLGNIDNELISNLTGYLAQTDEFIDEVSKKPTLFNDVYSNIKEMYYKARGLDDKATLEKIYRKYRQMAKEVENTSENGSKGVKYSVIGETGVKNLRDYVNNISNNASNKTRKLVDILDASLEEAKKERQQGKDKPQIFENTYWWYDEKDSKWKIELSNKDLEITLPKNIKVDKKYKISDIINNDLLTIAYPELNETTLTIKNYDKKGLLKLIAEFRGKPIKNTSHKGTNYITQKNIGVNKNILTDDNAVKATLLHEIQHTIQVVEGFSQGTSTIEGKLRYYSSEGEAEARTVSQRMELSNPELHHGALPFYDAQEYNKSQTIDAYLKTERSFIDKLRDALYTKQKENAYANENEETNRENQGISLYKENGQNSSKELEVRRGSRDAKQKVSYSIKDSQGNTLSKEQQEFFKNSLSRDENGNLKVMYHSTDADFNIFDINKSGNGMYGKGFYFTDDENFSRFYGTRVVKAYLDTERPLYATGDDRSDNQRLLNAENILKFLNSVIEKENINLDKYGDWARLENLSRNYSDTSDWRVFAGLKQLFGVPITNSIRIANDLGITDYDSIISRDETIVLSPNQIKNVDNQNPTENPDIRFSVGNNQGSAFNNTFQDAQVSQVNDVEVPQSQETEEFELPFDMDEEDNKKLTIEEQRRERARQLIDKKRKSSSDKAIKEATNQSKNAPTFNYETIGQLKNVLGQFEGLTQEQLEHTDVHDTIEKFVRDHSVVEYTYYVPDQDIVDIKNDIRNRHLTLGEKSRWGFKMKEFKEYYPGLNLSFGQHENIDKEFQELAETYPAYFDKNTPEKEIPYVLGEIMKYPTRLENKETVELSDDEIKNITDRVYKSLVNNSLTDEELSNYEKTIYDKVQRLTRKQVQSRLLEEMGIDEGDISFGKDIKALGYQIKDPVRLNESVFGYRVGKKINDATVNRTKHNEAEKIRWQNQERQEIAELGIKPRSKESAAVQKYGEGEYLTDKGQYKTYGEEELFKEFPNASNAETREKIKKAAKVLRQKYDDYIDRINNTITDLGYDAIPKRKDYFRHFYELDDKFSQLGIPFNRNEMNDENLPTDINGLTDQFKPGKNFFASALERTGMKTTYDAITGIDGYLEGAGNLIFHTEDIQRYRTLSNFIRNTYGQKHGFDNLDSLSDDEKEQRIKDIQSNKLSGYAAWLDEQANAIAGKKGGIDRSVERMFGRRVYTAANTLKKQIGSNMTGFNFRSSLTNFASALQGAAKTDKIGFMQGTISTIKNIIHKDDLIDRSDFLTNRFGSDVLSQKFWQKASNAGQIFMTATDYFTANQIWRGKYYENLNKGMSENDAIKNADDFSSRIMGDRSLGSTAEIFNSKTLGFLTQFQLEVNNQWQSLIHDNKLDIESGNKSGATVVWQLGQLAAFSYMFNGLMKGLTGSSVMIDSIDMLMKIFGAGDDDDKTLEQRAEEVLGDVVSQLPMASIFTGGRIPIAEAFSGASAAFKKATGQKNEYGNEYEWSDVAKEFKESIPYWFLPTGYGQLKKTVQGLGQYTKETPGSYTDSGNLRYEADTTPFGVVQSALFGRAASKNAREYFDKGYSPLKPKQIDEAKNYGMSISEYRSFEKNLKNASVVKKDDKIRYSDAKGQTYWYDKTNGVVYDNNDKATNIDVKTLSKVKKNDLSYNYVSSLSLDDATKTKILNSELNRKEETIDDYGYVKYKDITGDTYWYDEKNKVLYDSNYKKSNVDMSFLTKVKNSYTNVSSYATLDELNYATRYPSKYKTIQNFNLGYQDVSSIKSEIDSIKKEYKTNDDMSKAEKSRINKAKQTAVFDYIDGLEMNKYQKLALYKLVGAYSVKNQKNTLYDYIEKMNLTSKEKQTIYDELVGD